MVNYLIRYNRKSGSAQVDAYPGQAGRAAAIHERLRLEATSMDADDEVVVIAAESWADLRRTHARYFERTNERLSAVEASMEKLLTSMKEKPAKS